MNARKLTLIAVALLLVCQLGWAQQSTDIAALAAKAEKLGHGLPVVSQAETPRGYYRPFSIIGGSLTNTQKTMKSLAQPPLPSFCNTSHSYGLLLCPNALQTAYGTGSISYANGGAGMTIAIVDAFHYKNATTGLPQAETDLNNFASDMNLPACTSLSGCFRDLDQNGNDATHTTCGSNSGWEVETMLDLEYAHAMAPNAKLVLVEGCTNSFDDLGTAVTTAVGLGADVVSNSYGAVDFLGESFFDPIYQNATLIVFSSGDNGNPTSYPCSSPYVTCVGGTSLQVNLTTLQRITETGWPGSGGGCSVEELLPSYQSNNGVAPCGSFRATPDISAIAADTSEVAVLDSGGIVGNEHRYFRVWGTSLATPVMAGIFADLDTARTTVLPTLFRKPKLQGGTGSPSLDSSLYLKYAGHNAGNPYVFYYYDVVAGSNNINGTGCCNAGPGYDMVTGLGVLTAPHAGPPWNLP